MFELPWLILDGTQTIRYCYHRSPLTRTHHAKEGVRRGVRAGASVRIACAVIIDLRRQPRGFTSPLSSLQPISNSRRHRYPHINNRFVFNKYIKVLIGYYKIICTYLSQVNIIIIKQVRYLRVHKYNYTYFTS